jgi:hypothetical protein
MEKGKRNEGNRKGEREETKAGGEKENTDGTYGKHERETKR